MKHTIQRTENMTLAQCLRIKENQFRSADNSMDYCPFEIEQRIIDKRLKRRIYGNKSK